MAKTKVQDVLSDFDNKVQRADEVLRQIADEERKPTYDELVFFHSELNWSPAEVNGQVRRMNNVVRLQSVAGTADDRQKLAESVAEAKEVLKTRGGELRTEIDKLTVELNKLESSHNALERRHTEVENAVKALREYVPENVRRRLNTRKRMVKETLGLEISERKTRVNLLNVLLDPSLCQSKSLWFEIVQREDYSYAVRNPANPEGWEVTDSYLKAVPNLKQEREQILEEIEELQSRYDSELKDIEAGLDHYA